MSVDYSGHFAGAGPVAPTARFLEALAVNDFAGMWAEMDDNLRTVRAQAWIWNNRDHFGPAYADWLPVLMAGPSEKTPWPDFAERELHAYESAWSEWLELFKEDRLGAASRSRIIAPDLELVVWTETDPVEPIVFAEATAIEALIFAVSLDTVWRIASAGSDIAPEAGWPPIIA